MSEYLSTPTPERYPCATYGCDRSAIRVRISHSTIDGHRYGPFFYGECSEHAPLRANLNVDGYSNDHHKEYGR